MKKFPRWGLDLGYQKAIPTHDPNVKPSSFGLKGKKAQGRLSVGRGSTRKQGRDDAAEGIPPSEAESQDQWSECEQIIVEEADDVRRGLNTWFDACSASVRNFIHEMTPAELSEEHLREVIKAEENEIRRYEDDDTHTADAHYEETKQEYDTFRQKHGDAIENRTPDIKTNVEQTIAVLMFILILEGAFNALLFKDAQSGGLLGGLLIAFGVSAMNVVLGVTAGYFGLRWLRHHHEKPLRYVGWAIFGVFTAFGLFLNFFVAHFRDAVEAALHAAEASGSLAGFSMFDIAPGAVIMSMFPNIVGLENMVAFGLLFIGLIVFSISVYEGYEKISDKYPGYGRVWRKERKAYERRQLVRQNLRDDLSTYFGQCRTWFETQHTRHVEAKREIEKSLNWLETRRSTATAVASRCADQERSLKVSYRQAHRKMRNSLREKLGEQAAVPLYFEEMVTPELPTFHDSSERELAATAMTVIDLNITVLLKGRTHLEEIIQASQKSLKGGAPSGAGGNAVHRQQRRVEHEHMKQAV